MATPGTSSTRLSRHALFLLSISLCLLTCTSAWAERVFFAGYNGGFYIKSEEEGGMELRLGGSFQVDYRHYGESERADDRFDVRRARLIFRGGLTRWFKFGMEFEFQGNETSNLVDAYGEAVLGGLHGLRFGQFKEPFSLEWQTPDKAQWFAERSMGYYLGPKRDIGLMLHGSVFDETVYYAAGLFNGDGEDGSAHGAQEDAPEIAGRLVFRPFHHLGPAWLDSLQIGGSAGYADIDLTNVNLEVKTTGMVGTTRNIYVLKQNTKFGVLQDADQRIRAGLEAAWTGGPLALTGEAIQLKYTNLEPAGGIVRDADFSSAYLSVLWCLTGERPVLRSGVLAPIYPDRFFNPDDGTWGAFCLAGRVDHFTGDEAWITPGANVSVRKADAYSAALTWIMFPMVRVIFDYTFTEFSDPIRVRVQPDGTVDYIKHESVATVRLSLDF